MSDAITPFRIEIPERELDDLRRRLRQTRWPEPEAVDDWSQGIPLAYVRDLCEYWLGRYDWRACEASLNRFPQFRTEIDGLSIHFQHVRSPHADALPLVMTHGWPGSIVEFRKVIEPLTDPTAYGGEATDAFHVVCPALPGFGFSGKPARAGWGVERIADAWDALMTRLGYAQYGAQGGDWGSGVTQVLGIRHPDHLAGIHINMVTVPPDPATMDNLTAQEQGALAAMTYYRDWDSGYSKEQSTRPQTVGYGLVDSPRPVRLDRGEVLVLDGLRRRPGERADPGRDARQRDAVLAARHWRIVGTAVLGELWQARQRRPGAGTGWLLGVPQGDLPRVQALGREAVPRPPLLERAR